jgi:5,5'-dehydrodivanillate O-demethylase
MSEDFTLYRGESGAPYLVADRCPHRGAKLSLGTVEGEALRCAYHAWTFDGAGHCVAQPGEPRPFCERVNIRAHPVREDMGLIFAYLGESEPPPFRRALDFEEGGYLRFVGARLWPCSYFAQMENTLDFSHTTFLHGQFNYKKPDEMVVEETEYGLKVSTPGLSGIKACYDTHYHQMPNIQEYMAAPKPGDATGFYARSWRVPCDDRSFHWFDIQVYPLREDEVAPFKAKRAEQAKNRVPPAKLPELAQAVVDGKHTLDELERDLKLAGSDLIQLQDLTVMISLNPMADRPHGDLLGQTDVAVSRMRRLWLQELRNLAAGAPPRDWKRPDYLWEAARR